jgi:hypothetical protein
MVNNENKKPTMPSIEQVLNAIRQRDMFSGFQRYQYIKPGWYDLDNAMKIVEAIGKSRNPAFVIDDENRFAFENFIKWAHCDTSMKCLDPVSGQVIPGRLKHGIYIAGNTGTGKTWCMEIMQAYIQAIGIKVLWHNDNDPRPLYWRTIRADGLCDVWAESGNIQQYKTAPMLAIQDLGNEPPETLYMGNRLDVVRYVIEYRGDMHAEMTFITSNLRMGGGILKERYGDRVSSRLQEMCNYLVIKGKDRRKL